MGHSICREDSDNNGEFSLNVEPGDYLIIAIQKLPTKTPVSYGEVVELLAKDAQPITLKAGKNPSITLTPKAP